MARKTLTFALFALLAITANINVVAGQTDTTSSGRFDWVTGFGGRDVFNTGDVNRVVSQHIDSDGNLYVCGIYPGMGARLGDTLNLPFGPYEGLHPNMCVLFAKFSSDGSLLWHREAYGNYHAAFSGFAPMGDTAFVLACSFSDPSGNKWMNLFGTLYDEEHPIMLWTGSPFVAGMLHHTVFLTINTDGDIVRQHIVNTVSLDSDGNPLTAGKVYNNTSQEWMESLLMSGISPMGMTVDGEGNVVIMRYVRQDVYQALCDTCAEGFRYLSPHRGSISGYRIYLDSTQLTDIQYPNGTYDFNLQMLKFSPGFDSLLSSHLVIYDTVGEGESEYSNMEYADMDADVQWLEEAVYMNTDSENNIYISGTVVTPLYGRLDTIIAVRDSITGGWNTVHIYDTTFYRDLLLDSSDPSIRIHTHHLCPETGFLVKYSPSLDPQWANHLHWVKRSNTENGLASSIYLQTKITGEEVYVCTGFSQGYFGDSVRYYSVVCGMGDTLTTHLYKGAGFIRLNTEDGGYISSGCVPSSCGTGNGYGLAVQNNRVFMQVSYPRDLIGVDTVYQHNTVGQNATLALVGMDNEGRLISVYDYGNNESGCNSFFTQVYDSTLYLTGQVSNPLHLGDVDYSPHYPYSCYIAKYCDTAFMSPYIHTEDPGEVNITLVEGGNAFVAYPNPFRQSVKIRVESGELKVENGVATAWLTDIMGRREEVRLIPSGERKTESGERVYTLDLSGRPQATYLLTLTTIGGKTHTIRLMKISDIFSR